MSTMPAKMRSSLKVLTTGLSRTKAVPPRYNFPFSKNLFIIIMPAGSVSVAQARYVKGAT